ncbi:protein tyrosine phosphatase [bacterium 210820-DFI.6.37]|nr:protein tyrosine phosphatase [bacterium 210820-DFI.6.37]
MRSKWKYMDIHTHIVPGVDDGAKNMEETMKMVELAYAEGIRVIMATPHYGEWNPNYNKEQAIAACRKVRDWVRAVHSDMNVYMGNELYYSPGIIDDLRQGKARTMGGTDYVLVEFSVDEDYPEIYDGLRAFVMEGYRPILAHIERYHCLQKELESVKKLVDLGVYIQVNARSFLGGRFDRRTAWCTKLLENGLIHFVASDCHNCEGRRPIMETAVKRMLELTDEKNVERIVQTNVIKLMQNKYI